jgi:hypothetical protein
VFYQQNSDHKVTMIRLNPVQDDKDHVERGLFLVDDDLYSMLKQQKFKEILLTNTTTIDGEHDVAKYFKVEKSGIHYWISGMQKKRTLLVLKGITSYYFLSNQRVEWTMYGLASLRVCIVTQQ